MTAPLHGKKIIVTAGPTYEAIDPVRFIGNRSSGKQGYAIASALATAGADVTLISGPTALSDPEGLTTMRLESAKEMLEACESALPCDIAIFAAAVSDWTPVEPQCQKIKKRADQSPPALQLKENPDILKIIANHNNRPELVIGFAAETENLIENAKAKLKRKNCDWILANNVCENTDIGKVFGADQNHVFFIASNQQDDWGAASKTDVADQLVQKIIDHFKEQA